MTEPRRIPETKGDGPLLTRCRGMFELRPGFWGQSKILVIPVGGGIRGDFTLTPGLRLFCGCIALLPAALACYIGFVAMTIRPAFAEPDPGPIKVIRTEIDGNQENRLNAAYRAYQAGDIGAARAGYAEVLQAYPDNRDAMLGLAACAVVEGDMKSAVSMYRRILRAYPQDVLSRAALIGLQEDRQGEAVIREFLSRQPDEPYLHVVLGRLQAAQARWPEARRAFSNAQRIDPANPVYALNLAISLDRMGQGEEALEYYRATLKLVEQSASNLDIRPVIRRILALRQQ